MSRIRDSKRKIFLQKNSPINELSSLAYKDTLINTTVYLYIQYLHFIRNFQIETERISRQNQVKSIKKAPN